MRKLFIAFITMLLAATIYSPASAIPPAPRDNNTNTDYSPVVTIFDLSSRIRWKTYERYEISNIYGLENVYKANEPIIFYVQGNSGKLDVDETNGFSVVATMMEMSRNLVNPGRVTYDSERRAWEVEFMAPKDITITKEYKIIVNLFCKTETSPCAITYGFKTQVDHIIPLYFQWQPN